jgi:mannitol/fructose-specific phosphotransferase system IIA component (Ntr-type)/anti-anti-sigma regulatory factor
MIVVLTQVHMSYGNVNALLAAFLFVHRMSELGMVTQNDFGSASVKLDEETRTKLNDHKVVIFDIEGPLFFGAAKTFVDRLEKNFDFKVVILDIENVPIIDTTGAVALENIVDRLYDDNKRLLLVGLRPKVREILYNLGVSQKIGIGNFIPTMEEAIQYAIDITEGKIDHTHLASFIPEKLIILDLAVKSKMELFSKLASQASKTKVISNKTEFLQSILEREEQIPTIIGKKVAVPHGRVGSEGKNVVVLFARLKNEIVYNELTGETVKLIFMVSTGTNEKEYLTALRMIAVNIKSDSIYNRLLTAKNQSEIHHILSEIKIQSGMHP